MGFLKDLVVRLRVDNSKVKKGLDEASGKVEEFGGNLKKLKKTIKNTFALGVIGAMIKKIVTTGFELAKLGGQAKGVKDAFEKIGGGNYLNDLRKATKGTVDDLELMKQAVKANNFGIPLKNLGGLFEFARRRAKATGESVDYLTNSIVVGIGRKSPLILDNLGISASQLKDQLGGAAVASSSIGEVTAAVERIASEALGNMADDTLTAAERADQLTASWENVKVRFGEAIASNKKLNELLEATSIWLGKIGKTEAENTAEHLFKTIDKEGKTAEGRMKLLNTAYKNTKKNIKEAQDLLTGKGSRKINLWEIKGVKEKLSSEKEILEAIGEEIKRRNAATAAEARQLEITKEKARLAKEAADYAAMTARRRKDSKKELKLRRPKGSLKGEVDELTGDDTITEPTSLIKLDTEYEKPLTDAEERTQEFVDKMGEMAEDFRNSAVAGFSDGMQYMMDSIAKGKSVNAGALVAVMLTPLADMAIRVGEVGIATGIGIEAIKTSLETLGGAGAIVAGVALVAAGAAAKAGLSSIAKGGSSSGASNKKLTAQPATGGESAMIQGGEAAMASSENLATQLGNVQFKIEGDDLVGVFDRSNKQKGSF